MANKVAASEQHSLKPTVGLDGAVLAGLGLSDSAVLLAQGGSDGSDFGVHSSGENDAGGASFGDGGRAVGNVEAITRSGLVVEDISGDFANREGLSGKESLVGLEVDSLGEPIAC